MLNGKVAIVTGGGQGLGREEALALGLAGAHVIVNDISPALESTGERPADTVVADIEAAGGSATANFDDIGTWDGAAALVKSAFAVTGSLDVLVCNAGIVRDRMLHKMSEAEWDAVLRVNLSGHFFPLRHAAEQWRAQAKEKGAPLDVSVVFTTSEAAMYGHLGQANYTAAKGGVIGLAFTAATELQSVGVRVNVIGPRGRTPMTTNTFGEIPGDDSGFDAWDPANVAPFVLLLARPESAGISGQVFAVHGDTVTRFAGWTEAATIKAGDKKWSDGDLLAATGSTLVPGLQIDPPVFPITVG
ncbi:SDR family NAD(P)-dependent oxidoreductase [Nocardioides marmoriginsengisoli]|uniref:SDR family NAD(P)-dependent oxidoreductase n=1 Tax=Nocardioides marmoriginsengisoli TaxID=661483 RepID=A0A3N0CID7_9ACTN|nr:SDR family NAD(P)-dependent oxidoreductase [Nocardioides marmoriginsengisoli]RNL62776.1 SDR family NAD(P)-dependent oxidoreductase [Nocardioides marmoriginsengisoli]